MGRGTPGRHSRPCRGRLPARSPRSTVSRRVVPPMAPYGAALAAVKAFPAAIQAFQQALKIRLGDPETLLALGRVYLEEGDSSRAGAVPSG